MTVAGVGFNYSMPHLHLIKLDGGSIIRGGEEKVTAGLESVGHYLTRELWMSFRASPINMLFQQSSMQNRWPYSRLWTQAA